MYENVMENGYYTVNSEWAMLNSSMAYQDNSFGGHWILDRKAVESSFKFVAGLFGKD